MRTSDFDYHLPPELIAQEPPPERDASRLLVLRRDSGAVEHRAFLELPSLLAPGDLLVLNDTRVVPARLLGRREATGGRAEVLLVEAAPGAPGGLFFLALTKSGGRLKVGEWISLEGGRARARLVEKLGEEGDVVEIVLVRRGDSVEAMLEEVGRVPVPPYIRREAGPARGGGRDDLARLMRLDRERYQTVYAAEPGAVAAPTAGLHFTERVFRELDARGVERAFVTLHVGPGTFKPVKTDDLEGHRMDEERCSVSLETARAVAECRERGGRVVAVGTTVVRALESACDREGCVVAGEGHARIFVTPGWRFRAVDALLTNFHLPRGTPLVMVSAFAGRERVLAAYREAVRARYRFLSYGDAMLVLP